MDGKYQEVSGTSFSAPLVAGVAALVLQAQPKLIGQPDDLTRILRESATPLPEAECGFAPDAVEGVPNDATGWGFVYAPSAVDAARRWSP